MYISEISHYVIYFDVNGTMIASDAAGGRDLRPEDTVYDVLAQEVVGQWTQDSVPCSYDSYIRGLYPNREEFQIHRKQELAQLFSRMKNIKHPDTEKMQNVFAKAMHELKTLGQQGMHVFPSVYNLIKHLDQQGKSYTIMLRTFGVEGPLVAQEIEHRTDGKIRFSPLTQLSKNTSLPPPVLQKHEIIRDDYKPWGDNQKKRPFGKPYPIPNDPHVFTIFFDDNIRTDQSMEIYNIVNPYDADTKEPIQIENLLANGRLVRVDTLEAIVNKEYYVEMFQRAVLLSQMQSERAAM